VTAPLVDYLIARRGVPARSGLADAGSTALGLAVGAVEMNPLGPVLALAVKPMVLRYVKTLPDVERPAAYATVASVWGGAAANNICVVASILTGGGFAPACLVLGVAWGLKTWHDSEPEREFWIGCATLREYAQEPNMPCVYTPPNQLLAIEQRDYPTAQAD
jgi:hypothetical protein